MAWTRSANLNPIPTKTARWQCRWKLHPDPAMTGLVARYLLRPSEKSMIRRSRSSRSWVPPHADGLRECCADRVPLGLQVVPEQEVLIGASGHELVELGDPGGKAVAPLPGGLGHPEGGVAPQPAAAVPVDLTACRGLGADLMPVDLQRRQLVALVRVAEVRWLLQEQGPRGDPQPELALRVRQQGEPIRMGA